MHNMYRIMFAVVRIHPVDPLHILNISLSIILTFRIDILLAPQRRR